MKEVGISHHPLQESLILIFQRVSDEMWVNETLYLKVVGIGPGWR